MKKKIFYIVSVLALLTKCVSAQYITNYNLGKGYTYFKSVNKSIFLADLGFANNGGSYAESKMTGNPFYLMNIVKEQEIDKSSLLNILRQRNPDIATKYEAQLDKISEICNSGEKLGVSYYKRIFPDPRENP